MTHLIIYIIFRDLKCMSKVTSAVLIMRQGQAAEWTPDLDLNLTLWATEYIQWLTTSQIAIEESEATKWVPWVFSKPA